MLRLVSVQDAKRQLNISEDYTSDDIYIISLITAASAAVLGAADCELRDISKTTTDPDCPDLPVRYTDRRAQQATLLLVAHWYNNREAVTDLNMKQLPLGFNFLIQQLKKY